MIHKQLPNIPSQTKGLKMNMLLYEIVLYGLYVLEDNLRSEDYKNEIRQAYEEILNIDDSKT